MSVRSIRSLRGVVAYEVARTRGQGDKGTWYWTLSSGSGSILILILILILFWNARVSATVENARWLPITGQVLSG